MNREWLKRLVLISGLLLTLGLTWWTADRESAAAGTDAVVEAAPVNRPDTGDGAAVGVEPVALSSTASGTIRLSGLDRHRPPEATAPADPFKALSWYVPPPPPPQPVVVEKPRAPALPFQYVGRYQGSGPQGQEVFYLSRGEQSFALALGERIDETYVLESEKDGQLVFVYLPLGERQILQIGLSQ